MVDSVAHKRSLFTLTEMWGEFKDIRYVSPMILPGSGAAPQIHPLEPTDPHELGGYQLLGRIGAGGMGAVYLAETRTGRKLAIKAILKEFVQDPEFRTRFRREAAAAMKVRGRYLATLIDADPDGAQPWLAVEYVEGPSLTAVVQSSGPLSEPDLRSVIGGVAEALRSVHQAGIVHRDLKPSNILLGDEGPFVIDFGISQSSDSTSLTRTGLKVGTPAFMAPEQVRGSIATPAADVWALGAVALYAATGQRAFGEGDTTVVYYRVVHEPPDLSSCPAWLLPLVRACLAKDPQARPNLQEVLDFVNGVPADLRTATTKIVPGDGSTGGGSTGDGATGADPGIDDLTHVGGPSASLLPEDDDETVVKLAAAAPGADLAPEPEPEPTRRGWLKRPVTWLAAAGVVLVAGAVVTTAVLGSRSGAAPAGSASASVSVSASASASASSSPAAAIDECLVGSWEQKDLATQLPLNGKTYDTTGWNGRVLEFRADGTQVVDYADAEPLRSQIPAGEYVETWKGTTSYELTTESGVMTFDAVDYGDTKVTRKLGGSGDTFEPKGLSQPLKYTCDESTLTQWADGFEAMFTRLDQ